MKSLRVFLTLLNILSYIRPSIPTPTTITLANFTLPTTALVHSALDLISPLPLWLRSHVLRSWIYSTLIVSHNTTLQHTIDPEILALATLLHDLGWDARTNSPYITPDHRFEVDGAIAARDFIRNHEEGQQWEERRVQLVWDAIALHTERWIAYYKEAEVEIVSRGIALDFEGKKVAKERFGIEEWEYDGVESVFPKDELVHGVNGTIVWLCGTKAATTYDTWMEPWGDRYLTNYSVEGNQRIDKIFANLLDAN